MAKDPIEDVLPLGPLQRGLLFHARLDERDLDVYVAQICLDLTGPLDAARLRAAATALLRRHASLRAAFQVLPSGEPVQVITREVALPWRQIDLSAAGDAQVRAEAVAAQERTARFDMTRPPLLRFALIGFGGERWRLLLTGHHILWDGWSTPVLTAELLRLYSSGGDDAGLPPVTPFRDYLAWLAGQDGDAGRAVAAVPGRRRTSARAARQRAGRPPGADPAGPGRGGDAEHDPAGGVGPGPGRVAGP
jgi:hypothetical protein